MKKKLLIFGAGGHGKVVADIATKMNKWDSIYFLDDNLDKTLSKDLKVIDTLSNVMKYIKEYDIFVAIGDNTFREKIHKSLEREKASIPTLIHPSAIISEHVKISCGVVIMAGSIINCYSEIGKGTIINTGSTIDHENKLEDFVHISPGVHIAGNVRIGKGTWIGIGSSIINNVKVVGGCQIGAGSIIIRDILEPGIYVGAPAKRIK